MIRPRREHVARAIAFAVAFSAALTIGTGATAATTAGPVIVYAERLHVGSGEVIERAGVAIENGRIIAVGARGEITEPAGASVIEAIEVTPGLIDASTSAGLSGLRNVSAVLDQDEQTAPDQAGLRAVDAFDPRDPLLRYLLEHGTTLVQTGPGPASPIAGQAGIFRTHGTTADEMAVRFPSAMVFNLGDVPKATFSEEGPSTRMGTAALIRQRLAAGQRYARDARSLFRSAPDEPDLALEALGAVANGELTAIFHARRADDILTALRLTREFRLKALIAGATEGYLVRDPLRKAGIPVIVGPITERIAAPETENASYENAALLAEVGVPLALRTGFESYVPKNRVLLFEAAIAAANGLGRDRALRAITLDAARLLDVAEDYGSLEVGKVADLVLFDGDPFEYTTHVTGVIAAGEFIHTRETLAPQD